MNSALDALYEAADDSRGMAYWLFDASEAEEYSDCSRFAEIQRQELGRLLSGAASGTFEGLMDNLEEKHGLECRIMFNRGLSVGIRLASLGRVD